MLGFAAVMPPGPFESFQAPQCGRRGSIRRSMGVRPAQWLGIVGSALLICGVFVPAFGYSSFGESLLEVSSSLDIVPVDALIVLVFAVASIAFAWKDHCVLLWLTGIGCQMALASTYALWHPGASTTRSHHCLCFQISTSGLLPGWWIMELGLLLLLVAAFLGDLPER
ncbi:MAG: hypothetical protein K2R98_09700 [Gemmataceae bacterium]|nr:hypothetical protein [Gemmataceae bacterium]